MGELLAGAVLGTVANELVVVIKFMVKKTGACKHLQKTLEGIIPILDEVDKIGVDRFPEHSRKQLKEFHQKLQEGKKMVQSVSRVGCWNVLKLLKWSVKIRDLENYIKNFTQKQGWIHVLSEVCHLRKDFCQRMEINEQDRSHHSAMLQMIKEQICPEGGGVEDHDSILQIPESPKFQVGLNVSVEELKEQLFAEDVSVLGVKGIGGSGKTTLAVALCKHPQVKAHFQEKIIFETVSQSPNLKGLLENLWKKISRQRLPNFHNVEDARTQIQKFLRDKMPQPILVVLDDVWAQMDLETLLFEAKGYKTVVTTRRNFALFDSVYDLQLLREEYALSPFCFSAFKQESIPETEDENLVKQVVAECKGLPLALKVIGRSLHQQPRAVWLNAKNQLSQAEVISDYQKDGLLKRMSTSIYVLEDKVQQCFLDLGLFPEDKKIPVDALMDIWVYVHDLDLHAAYTILMELASRNLLNLVNNGMNHPGISYGMNCEAYVVQHDVLRDLAIYLAKQESITKCKRLVMPQKEDCIPKSWKKHREHPFDAQIISIHTGRMDEEHWCEMEFPKAEALILIFDATEYFLPTFLWTMHKLKALILVNHNSEHATLKGLSVFFTLAQLKSVRLERVIVPSLQGNSNSLEKIEKLSLIMCKGLDNINGLDTEPCSIFSGLREITIDHCSYLEKFPTSICNMTSLQKLSVTNCHDLFELSDDLWMLSSLQMLRLHACPSLKVLPESICKLGLLEVLDISLCECMEKLPDRLDQLSSLKVLDMKECSRMKELPKSASEVRSLEYVICGEKIKDQWLHIKASTIPKLRVEVAAEIFNLDWLEN